MAEISRMKIADDLYVVMVDAEQLREQDINAQVMQPADFERLTENIRQRGMIESLPYVHQADPDKPIEIVSGHHRVRAAKQAGVKRFPVILDTRKMRRSEITAKQIAHNQLSGTPDEQILRQMVAMIDNVDDLLTTGLPDDFLPTIEADSTPLKIPAADFDWRMVTLMFLPSQLEDFEKALDRIDKHSEITGLAGRDQFQDFSDKLYQYARLKNIRSISTAVSMVTDLAAREIEAEAGTGIDQHDGAWVPITALTGTAMPREAAEVVYQALERMRAEGDINHPWQALEMWAADYLGS